MNAEEAWEYVLSLKTSTMATKRGKRFAVHVPNHPKCNNRGYVLRARYVVELVIERYLLSSEEVHHIDENRENDRYENLEILSKDSHAKHHITDRENLGAPRLLDYDAIKLLKDQGLGYIKIARQLGYKPYAVKSALRRIL